MTKLLPILFLLLAGVAQAAERITATITVTNTPGTTNSITINSTFRYWTNASTLGTILTNLTGKNAATTNLYNQIASYPYPGGVIVRWADTNQIQLIGSLGGALAGSIGGTWATLTLATQSGPQTYTALWPMENMVGATNRTNQASALVSGLSDYSTNALATNSTANSNFLTKGASPVQTAISPFYFSGRIGIGGSLNATNGFTSGITNINPVASNLVNYGNAIRSEGIGANSLQVGSNAVAGSLRSAAFGVGALATNTDSMAIGTGAKATTNIATAIGNSAFAIGYGSLAVGESAVASNQFSTAIGQAAFAGYYGTAVGQGSIATNHQSIAIGVGAEGQATNSIAIGTEVGATGVNSTAIGNSSTAAHNDSTAIGRSALTTTTNQIRLGTSADTVSVPGIIDGPVSTNATLRGTNIINGRIDFTSRANTSLANGNNAGVVLGTNVYVRLSGPSASYTINGIAAEQDGSWHICEFANPVNSLIIANQSGTDPTAANRIVTGTGADVTFTNNPVVLQFIYNAADARWKIANWFR